SVVGIDEAEVGAVDDAGVGDVGDRVGEEPAGQNAASGGEVRRGGGASGEGDGVYRHGAAGNGKSIAQRHAELAAGNREHVEDVAAGGSGVGHRHVDEIGRAAGHLEIRALAEIAEDLVAVALIDGGVAAERPGQAGVGIGELAVGDGIIVGAV